MAEAGVYAPACDDHFLLLRKNSPSPVHCRKTFGLAAQNGKKAGSIKAKIREKCESDGYKWGSAQSAL